MNEFFEVLIKFSLISFCCECVCHEFHILVSLQREAEELLPFLLKTKISLTYSVMVVLSLLVNSSSKGLVWAFQIKWKLPSYCFRYTTVQSTSSYSMKKTFRVSMDRGIVTKYPIDIIGFFFHSSLFFGRCNSINFLPISPKTLKIYCNRNLDL